MKKIYIVLTCTGTILSNIVKVYTKDEFTHSSIALDKELVQLYSFGRKNPYNPYIGCFVQEGIHIGTFKRFKNTLAGVYELEVTDEQYDKCARIIEDFKKNKNIYKFNILGLFLISLKYKRKKEKYFYCSEFVKYVLEEVLGEIKELPDLIRPENFKDIPNIKKIYSGLLRNYK